MPEVEYDVIIVGAGSCGGTLAARLAEDPDRHVLVLEAGSVYRSVAELPASVRDPGDISDALPGGRQNWELIGELCEGHVRPIPRGKVIGGSSSINAAYFIRGTKENFAEWDALGNDEWSYERVLTCYMRSETDLDFGHDSAHHGVDGPISVRREGQDRAPAFTEAFTEAALTLGFPLEADKNAAGEGGVGPVPMNIVDGLRISSAVGYLLPNLTRPNLTVKGGAHVTRILFRGQCCAGVEAIVDGVTRPFYAAHTVLAAGALRTPQILMLSGVGPEAQLREHAIDVCVDLPGVGQNLMDHPKVSSPWRFRGEHPAMPGRGVMTSGLNWTAQGSRQPGDLEILPFVATPEAMFHLGGPGMQLPIVQISVLQEDSRGEVRLASADPLSNPTLRWNFFTEKNDRARFREGMRVLYELFHSPPMRAIGAELLELERHDLTDPATMDAWMVSHIWGTGHPSCTCRMGPESDPLAVVDQYGLVRGVEGLRICDQSVFPKLTSRGPSATAIMLGERMSDFF